MDEAAQRPQREGLAKPLAWSWPPSAVVVTFVIYIEAAGLDDTGVAIAIFFGLLILAMPFLAWAGIAFARAIWDNDRLDSATRWTWAYACLALGPIAVTAYYVYEAPRAQPGHASTISSDEWHRTINRVGMAFATWTLVAAGAFLLYLMVAVVVNLGD